MQPSQKEKPQPKNQRNTNNTEGQITIRYYTDPLCCWSWALEPHWRRLLENYGPAIRCEYVMGGMIPSWSSYNDPMNSVSKPMQMGPVWMHASQVTHVKMNYSIWATDPPLSSYPPSIAVKTVGLQSPAAAEEFLFIIRSAMMNDGLNISKPEILFMLAKKIASSDFDYTVFESDWKDGRGKDAFRMDLQQTKFHNIGRFPTLTFQNTEGRGIMITGYRPYDVLENAFLHILHKKVD